MLKSILKPEHSVLSGLAVVASVFAIYQLSVGNVSQAHASTPNHPALDSSRKKAGWESLLLVSGLTLITKDANIGILGAGAIIGMEISYRHAIMAPENGRRMANPGDAAAYSPAEDAIPMYEQGEPG